ncbi:patatin-like phospholipase domain-containing protein 4 [Babylonia areolata]|uniref:patatin-like phospholipase domain-containing protein 4 n=1 Tax=Babylonia areolata TaxID=304850 RepID=UPI003FD39EB9
MPKTMNPPRSAGSHEPTPDRHQGDTTPPILGRRHRARSADHRRSRTTSSDCLSTTTAATTTTTTGSNNSIHQDWNPAGTSHSYPEVFSPGLSHSRHRNHHHHHHPPASNDSHRHHHHQRLYHSDFNIHHQHHRHHQHPRRHHSHQHDPDPDPDPDPPRRRRRRRHEHHSSESSLPSSSSYSSSSYSSTTNSRSQQRSRSSSQREGSPSGSKDTLNVSLCGCGFIGVYHLGVVSCLLKHGPSFLARVDRVAGASAGALAAALLVTAPSLRNVQMSTELVTALAKKVRRKPLGALTPGYQLTKELERLLDRVLPHDAHLLARGRLHVSLTDVSTKENEVLSDFESREELIQALVASCHIPVYSGVKPPWVKGKAYCDGGLSNNLVQFSDGRTVTVSPFSGQQDIGPRDSLTKGSKGIFFSLQNQDVQANLNNMWRLSHALFPPCRSLLQQYLELGHKDASRFLVREGLYEILKPPEKPPLRYESSV